MLADFQSGIFSKTLPPCNDPNLKPLVDKINETARILEAQAQAQAKELVIDVVLDSIVDGFVIQDSNGAVKKFNPAALELLGLTGDQLQGRTPLDPQWSMVKEDGSAFLPEEHPGIVALATGLPVRDVLMKLKLKDGTDRWIKVNAAPFDSSQGRGAVCTFTDVTDVQRMTSELKHIFSHTMDLMCIANTAGIFKRVNPSFYRILGFEEKELIAKPFTNFIHPDDLEATRKIVESLSLGVPVVGFENRYRTKSGKYRRISWVCEPDTKTGMLYATGRDVTDLKNSEYRNQQILDAINRTAIFAFTDVKGAITDVNDNFCKISGYSREELIGKDHRILNSGRHSKAFFEEMWSTIKSGKSWVGDIENRKKTGEHYFVRTVVSAIKNENSEIEQFVSIRFDVTEQKQTEQRLNEAQAIAKTGSWQFNLRNGHQTWSDEHYRIFEIDKPQSQESLHKLYRERIHPDDLPGLDRVIDRALKMGEDFIFNHRVCLDNGKRVKFVQGIGRVTRDGGGQPVYISGTCQDLTELVRIQEENRFILDALKIGLWKFNPVDQSLFWDKSMYELFDLKEGEFSGHYQAWESTLTAEGKAKAVEELGQALRGEKEFETVFEINTRSKGKRSISGRGKVLRDSLGNPIMMYGVNMDVTSERKANERFVEGQKLLATVLDALPLAVFGKDIKNGFQWKIWNKAAEDMFGLKAKDCLGKYDSEFLPKEQAEFFKKKDLEASRAVSVINIPEEHVKTQHGDVILRMLKTVVRDEIGEPHILVGITENITETKNKDRILVESQRLLASILKYVPGPVYSKTPDGKYIFVNEKFLEVVPVPDGDITQMTDKDIFPKKVADALAENDCLIIKDRKERFYRETVPHPDGSVRTYDTYKFPIFGEDGEVVAVTGISFDISKQILAEAKFEAERIKSIRNAKLASLGEMSAGIAHEINNPLAIISGSVGLLSKFVDNPEKFSSKIQTIKKSCDRIARIVNGLRKFSRSGDRSSFKNSDVGSIVDEALVLTESKSKRHATPVSVECKSIAKVRCDDIEIEQVLVNLINNSIDAVKSQPEKWVKVSVFEDDTSVVLRVMDSGSGIPEHVRSKLFDPFFTTKRVGEGTGLGLSIAKGILDEHGATIAVLDGVPNTCFEIRFPKADMINSAA